MEAGLGHALARARRRLRDVGQGPDRLGRSRQQDLPHPRQPRRRKASTTSCSWTRRARRSPSPRATASAVEEWLTYAPPESLALFMFQKPRAAKRLYFDVIPRAVDDYLTLRRRSSRDEGAGAAAGESGLAHPQRQAAAAVARPQLRHPAQSRQRRERGGEGAALGLTSRATAGGDAAERAVPRQAGRLRDQLLPRLREAGEAVPRAERDRAQGAAETAARISRARRRSADAETLQTEVYEIGKRHPFPELRAWFKALYEVLLGQDQGPRFGSFIALYGRKETIALIKRALAGEMVSVGQGRASIAGSSGGELSGQGRAHRQIAKRSCRGRPPFDATTMATRATAGRPSDMLKRIIRTSKRIIRRFPHPPCANSQYSSRALRKMGPGCSGRSSTWVSASACRNCRWRRSRSLPGCPWASACAL